MDKTIIIGLPKSFSFHENIEKNLTLLGFKVINISFIDHDFKYPSFFYKSYNFIRKTFLKDKCYKGRLKFRRHAFEVNSKLNSLTRKADYAILIRPDIYPIEIIKKIKLKSKKMIGYQWDGLHRFPAVYESIKYFDRFFVFDETDLNYEKKQLLPLTNFYFDYDNDRTEHNVYDVFFVGSFVRKRMQSICNLANALKNEGLIPKIAIYCQPETVANEFPNENIEYIFKHMSYKENIAILKNSAVVLDFLNHAHKGLSFRTFEALFYDKKLITTNSEVKKYDFYRPENIFIWDTKESSIPDLLNFLKIPYIKIDENIKAKYSFTNWIHYVLNIEPFTNIELPN